MSTAISIMTESPMSQAENMAMNKSIIIKQWEWNHLYNGHYH